MLPRRQFLSTLTSATGFLFSCGAGFRPRSFGRNPLANPLPQRDPESADDAVTLIAYNVYGGTGWPKDRWRARKTVELEQFATRLANELALYSPDIVTLSESPSEKTTLRVADLLQMHHVRFPSGGHWPGTLLSRFPIIESTNVPLDGPRPPDLFTRHWGRAVLAVADDEEWVIHSAHLFPTADPAIRLREIEAMIQSMHDDLAANRPMVLMGDLNHGPQTEEYRKWTDAGWHDTYRIARREKKIQEAPAPNDGSTRIDNKIPGAAEDDGATIPADRPKWRIDYVWVSKPLANRVLESKPLFEGAFRLNVDDPESFALSDHLPQLARIQPDTSSS